MGYTLTYNGYTVEFLESYEAVEKYILGILEQHKNLNPKEIYRGYATDNKATNPSKGGTLKSVIIWQYNTMYSEVFMIEER